MKLGKLVVIAIAAIAVYSLIRGGQETPGAQQLSVADPGQPPVGGLTTRPAPPTPSGDTRAARALTDLTSKVQEAVKDPVKVIILECAGVRVYQDPQPSGHPPPAEACQYVNEFLAARRRENPAADAVEELRAVLLQMKQESEQRRQLDAMRAALAELPVASAASE